MTKDHFIKNCKSVRVENRVQHTGSFSYSRSFGFDYYVYVCPMTFETFNPYTKKHKDRPYKSFFSSISAEYAKELAYNYIVKNI